MLRIQRFMKSRAGFTLVELLVVIVVIGILAGIAVPRFMGFRERARVAGVESDLRNIYTALEMYHMEEGEYPDDLDKLSAYLESEIIDDYEGLYAENPNEAEDLITVVDSVDFAIGDYTVILKAGGEIDVTHGD